MKGFQKRHYTGLCGPVRDWGRVLRHRRGLWPMLTGKGLDPAFRERLMLAVTQVNDCRYCSFVHTRAALAAGVPPEELDAIARGQFEEAPEEQRPALVYAQHWAESQGAPDGEAVERLTATYGEAEAAAIHFTIAFIYACNLGGNTADFVLNTVTLGLAGGGTRSD